jgi:hypothetical protein
MKHKVANVRNTSIVKVKKAKKVAHPFLLSVPKARKVTRKGLYGYTPPDSYKVKGCQSDEVMRDLLAGGWVVEGKIWRENNTTYGMVKGDDHIVVTDTGKPPYYLGDTLIELSMCTRFEEHTIQLR